jgi:hypothetical protein
MNYAVGDARQQRVERYAAIVADSGTIPAGTAGSS